MTTQLEFERALDLKTPENTRTGRAVLQMLRRFNYPPARIKRAVRVLVRWTAFAKLEAKASRTYESQTQQRFARELLRLNDEEMIRRAITDGLKHNSFWDCFTRASRSLDDLREDMLNPAFVRSVLTDITNTRGRSGRKGMPFRAELLDMLVSHYALLGLRPTFAPHSAQNGLWQWLSLWQQVLRLPFAFSNKQTRSAVERYRLGLSVSSCEVSGNKPD